MKLALLNGSKAGETVDLKPPGISLGRETDNDVSILEAGMSRYHAKVELIDGEWKIRDMGSTNGVKVNGEKIKEPRSLSSGDEFQLGDQKFRVENGNETKSDPEPPLSVIAPRPSSSLTQAPPSNESKPVSGGGASPPEGEPTGESLANAERKTLPGAGTKSAMDPDEVGKQGAAGGDIFGKMDFFGRDDAKKKAKDGGFRFKRPGNFLFYVCVIAIPLIFLSLFIMFFEDFGKKSPPFDPAAAARSKTPPLLLVYEKNVVEPDNVFRYRLKVENGSATVELDDLKHQRHYEKTIDELGDNLLEELESSVKRTDFMRLRQGLPGQPEGNIDEERMLIVGLNGEMNQIRVKNTFAPTSFEEIEALLEEFSKRHLSVGSLQLTVDEMREEAQRTFEKAEQLYSNRGAAPGNLNEAVKRYKIVLELLDAFVPKPEIWDVSRRRRQEAETMMDKIIKDHEFNAERLIRTKNFVEARAEMKAIMEMTDPDDRRYQGARKWVLKLDQQIRSQRK